MAATEISTSAENLILVNWSSRKL